MSQLFYLLLILACPLGMIFMMRGMGRGRSDTEHVGTAEPGVIGTATQDARIAELEREVVMLIEERGAAHSELVGAAPVTAAHPRRRS